MSGAYVFTFGKSGRRKKTVIHLEALLNSRQRPRRGPDRQALILIFAQLETSPRTEWVFDENVVEQL